MRRVVVFNGLGVAEPNAALPPGVWQRGQPSPARDAAIWYRTNALRNTEFPPTNPTPAANCRICPPGDTSPDCCTHSTNMPLYTNWGREAYLSSFKPWNQDSQVFDHPPTTSEVIGHALEQSLRQSQLEMARPAVGPDDPSYTLSGFLASSGQNHLLAGGQNHLLGYTPRYSPFGCTSCNGKLSGVFMEPDGSFTTTGKVAIGVGVAAAAYGAYRIFRKKRR